MADQTNGKSSLHPSPTVVDAAIQRAMQEAVVSHALAGRPVAIWRDGQVAWVQPDEVLRTFPRRTSS
ncbi:MAG: hypothetical protein NTZ32_19740 [Planctomycetales bacterium]|nr:hypothetical protein [Planctomycetales bacterium]